MNRSLWHSAGILFAVALIAWSIGLLYSKGSVDLAAQDHQPIPFSHAFHSGKLAIDCLYCHRFAHQSPTAGIPSMNLCMGCHQNINAESDAQKTLLDHWERRQPLAWVRLQRLPDFVYFTHERHLAHGLQCVNCHGLVDATPHTPRAATYEMGWCLACHQERGASRDCVTCHK
jgi:hypothetical protein